MVSVEFNQVRSIVTRVDHDSDLIQFLTVLAEEREITTAVFTALGALKCATIGFYDQATQKYLTVDITAPHEIASCTGNVSLKDGKPFVHAHAVLSDEKGNTKAGHLIKATIFAAEVHLQVLHGPKLARTYDEVTGLSLWEIENQHSKSADTNDPTSPI